MFRGNIIDKILAFDGDVIAHTIASACEKRSIDVTHKATGRVKSFPSRTEFYGHWRTKQGGWLAEANKNRETKWLVEDFDIVDVQTPEPLQNCLHSVKAHLLSICRQLNVDNYKVLIGDGECFRHEILMPKGRRYKQNREGQLRALMVGDVKDYLIKHHNAEVVRGKETDDQLSILSHESYKEHGEDSPIIVVTRDKDAGGCNGWWFNSDWMTEPLFIDGLGKLWLDGDKVRGIGRKFSYFQLLVGDDADGFKPSKTPNKAIKYGEKTAYELLKDLNTDRECMQAVSKLYREWLPEPQTYEAWNGESVTDNWISWLDKHFKFVHMWRWDGDFIDMREMLKTFGCLGKNE